ncbi:MAG: hypothetical protein AB8I08_12075 [Sandaracinaceae bacterium]
MPDRHLHQLRVIRGDLSFQLELNAQLASETDGGEPGWSAFRVAFRDVDGDAHPDLRYDGIGWRRGEGGCGEDEDGWPHRLLPARGEGHDDGDGARCVPWDDPPTRQVRRYDPDTDRWPIPYD